MRFGLAYVVTGEMMDAGLGKHGVVYEETKSISLAILL